MEITRESEADTTDIEPGEKSPPTLTVVAAESRPEAEMPAAEKDWDPFVVWRKMIRRSSDAA